MRRELNILIGGEAGQGLVTVGELLTRALIRSGYQVHVTQSYMSRIRGGHNTYAVRAGIENVHGPAQGIDILVALNSETLELHREELTPGAVALKDKNAQASDLEAVDIPFADLAGSALYENVVGLGVLSYILGLDREMPAGCIRSAFEQKKPEAVDKNLEVLDKAYAFASKSGVAGFNLDEPKGSAGLMLAGNQALALGALCAGANFCSYYPMTPSTGIPMTLNSYARDFGMVVEQAEDEIAAINMALGASYAGARSMVATSGGGFALMCEGVSLSGMTETPVVIVVGQRPGPATGLPTRTEQGDLNLVLYSGHGEFPRAVLAPADPGQCFVLARRAFDLAEKSQGPVFILTDQYLADSYRNVHLPDPEILEPVASPEVCGEVQEEYERYAFTPSGVSPRIIPAMSRCLVVLDSDEHTPDGHITEDLQVRKKMVDKRLKKGDILKQEVILPAYTGPQNPKDLLVCWGSTRGPALEAREIMGSENTAVLHFSQVWPLDAEHFRDYLQRAQRVVFVESNATAQFAQLVSSMVQPANMAYVLRYDGLPLDGQYIADNIL
ncbi:pyruvate flavodoxin/ferredoxin oxidoreductase domain protein [Desulfonatronospira thiodismutans ASO3-1]|uniref:Pyruvate flavodoxin/ferredoxin oxidoreductase domain protein n=1 Tax=Desulfonatronospira thiodismutans ASO3-1 TaxID=555779 RepID=D6SQJ9_9BACT|nr:MULTISPECIES: 2-oxoacid:acceptor oxidoreductase subunit alpha [Desulfonatronospira]EFI35025.1 pyruvate flavodoxin/ferredoxin oxidoreductase domain protein [Desulfonatronospira thiodismutans ASO3-1]